MRAIPSIDFVDTKPPGVIKETHTEKDTAKKFRSFTTMLQKVYRNLTTVVNGNIGFGDGTNADNINGVWQTVTFPTANTDVTITHNLGRVPVGYQVMTKSAAGDIYTGSVPATTTRITLRSTVGGVTVNLFIV